ncbi:MAG: response regulator [Iodobacter sp.]
MSRRIFQLLVGKRTAFSLKAAYALLIVVCISAFWAGSLYVLFLIALGLLLLAALFWSQIKAEQAGLKVQTRQILVLLDKNEDLSRATLALEQARSEAVAAHQQMVEMSEALPLVVFQMQTSAEGIHHYHFINQRVEEILGVSAAELMQDPELRWRYVHDDDQGVARQALRQASAQIRAGAEPQKLEITLRLVLQDQLRWLLFIGRPSVLQADQSVIWNGYYQDITERKYSEDELRESEAYNKMLFQQSHRPLVVHDPEVNGFIDCNEAAVKIYGFSSREEVLGKTPLDVSAPFQYDGTDSKTAMERQDHSVLNRGMEVFEWRHQRANGEIWDAMVYLMEFNYHGRKLLQFTLDDITERKRDEKKILFNRFVVENSGPMLWLDPATAQVKYANKAAIEYLGYPGDELLNLTVPDFDPDFNLERYLQSIRVLRETGKPHTFETRHRCADGRILRVEITSSLAEDDEQVLVIASSKDITAQKIAEAAMLHARVIAEEAVQIKSDFLANMSHEIRTPLNAIIGLSHLVLKTELNMRQQDYLQKIQQSGQHLLGIINDILDFSKIESGKLNIECSEFKLDELLNNVASLIAEKISAKNIELIFDIGADVPVGLIGDALRLSQILINYTNNAVKFTDQGEIKIVIRTREVSNNGVLLHFSVKDTGIGLTPEQAGQLFQSFQQADTSTSRKYGGTGLGLAISKKLAGLMGGEVGVESEYGRGSDFWFTARLGIGRQIRPDLLPRLDLRGRRVLVVDDNHSARTVLADMLSGMNLIVSKAESGAQAIQAVQRAEPLFDLILLDWQMPGMNGIETARQIQRLLLNPPPRIVMVTAYSRDDVLPQCKETGIEYVLTKPVNASVLLDVLMNLSGDNPPAISSPAAIQNKIMAGSRILLAEDNLINQMVAAELLRDAGFLVDVAANGLIALEMAQTKAYDLVLMDMQMPVMDGLEATRRLAALPELVLLPVVAMTANAMQADRERCLAAGMVDFVTKPIEPEALFNTLQRWIRPGHKTTVLPASVAGLDRAAGLACAKGSEAHYLAVLQAFVFRQSTAAEEIRQALAQNNPVGAGQLAAVLCRWAEYAGATSLQRVARVVAEEISGEKWREETLSVLQSSLSKQLALIRAALNEH